MIPRMTTTNRISMSVNPFCRLSVCSPGSLFQDTEEKFHADGNLADAQMDATDTGGKGLEAIGAPESMITTAFGLLEPSSGNGDA